MRCTCLSPISVRYKGGKIKSEREWSMIMLNSHVGHVLFIFPTWNVHACDMIPAHVRHDPFTSGTGGIHMCFITYAYVRHDSLTSGP